jgi:hypothetical protein
VVLLPQPSHPGWGHCVEHVLCMQTVARGPSSGFRSGLGQVLLSVLQALSIYPIYSHQQGPRRVVPCHHVLPQFLARSFRGQVFAVWPLLSGLSLGGKRVELWWQEGLALRARQRRCLQACTLLGAQASEAKCMPCNAAGNRGTASGRSASQAAAMYSGACYSCASLGFLQVRLVWTASGWVVGCWMLSSMDVESDSRLHSDVHLWAAVLSVRCRSVTVLGVRHPCQAHIEVHTTVQVL